MSHRFLIPEDVIRICPNYPPYFGDYTWPGEKIYYYSYGTCDTNPYKTCHGCNGKGWVEVSGKAQLCPVCNGEGKVLKQNPTIIWNYREPNYKTVCDNDTMQIWETWIE